ncbi:MAG: GNAT family N-acetyltransferase, partial [Planctomycetota bacterium]
NKLTLGYVAQIEGKVVGYIFAEGRALEFGSPLCGWIFAIAVDPEFARKGIALRLCREVCLKFKALGIHTIRTLVRKDDVAILSFFRASGFRAGPFMELELEL